jgi:hypothetical protein
LTVDEAGKALGMSTATAYRPWKYARAWLYGELPGTVETSSLIVPAAVIDLRERARKNADAVVTIDGLKAWEKRTDGFRGNGACS